MIEYLFVIFPWKEEIHFMFNPFKACNLPFLNLRNVVLLLCLVLFPKFINGNQLIFQDYTPEPPLNFQCNCKQIGDKLEWLLAGEVM